MNPRSTQASHTFRWSTRLVFLLVGAVVICAGLDLLGWWFHLPILTSAIPHYATMKPNTAMCLSLLAVAAFARAKSPIRSGRPLLPNLAVTLATLALLLSGASLAEYITGKSLGIDEILATVPVERFGDPTGRMALGTAVCLVLTSLSLLLLDLLPRLSTGLVLTSLLASISGLVGFLLQAGPLVDVIWFKSLAVHTATGLLLVQLATLASRPDREPYSALSHQTRVEGSRPYLLFAVLLLPVVLAIPVTKGLQRKLYEQHFALALLVVLLMAVQTLVLWADSLALARVEMRLREKEAESSRILQSIGDGVIVTDTSSRVVRMNPLAERLTGWTLSEAEGRSLLEIFPIFSEVTGSVVENPVATVLRLGTVVGLANHTVLRRRDGRMTHIDDSSAPIVDENGQLNRRSARVPRRRRPKVVRGAFTRQREQASRCARGRPARRLGNRACNYADDIFEGLQSEFRERSGGELHLR